MTQHPIELRHDPFHGDHPSGHFVVETTTGRLLAGVGHNPHRAWVFPLNTPRGLNVVQEYPFDHPFHNGVFVGQAMVTVGGREAHFWAPAPDWRNPTNHIYRDIGLLKYGRDEPAAIEPRSNGFRITYNTIWCDEREEPMLEELRTIDVYSGDDGTICDVVSAKTAAYGDVHYAANKHGTIGVRVQPQLQPILGGEILGGDNSELRRGHDDLVSGRPSDFVAYEADVPGLGRFGVCLIVRENSAATDLRGPWFIRDYGMAMFNATMHDPIDTPAGETWTAALRVIAYDGALTSDRVTTWAAS